MDRSGFIGFLDRLFEECSAKRLENNVYRWFDVLCVLSLNLSTEMSEDDYDRCEVWKRNFLELSPDKLPDPDDEHIVLSLEVEKLLGDWEKFLRRVRKDNDLQQDIKIVRRKFS